MNSASSGADTTGPVAGIMPEHELPHAASPSSLRSARGCFYLRPKPAHPLCSPAHRAALRAVQPKPRPRWFRPRRLVCRCVVVPERRAAGAALVRRPPRGVLQRLLHDAGYSPKRRASRCARGMRRAAGREGRTKLVVGVWRSVGVYPVRGIGFCGGSRFRA